MHVELAWPEPRIILARALLLFPACRSFGFDGNYITLLLPLVTFSRNMALLRGDQPDMTVWRSCQVAMDLRSHFTLPLDQR